ncbi:trimeric intracellular cation channel family protein [Anaeromyxobacter oryzisoli]|uniref:trimeric intracellular cation channel family protein n=1 Tax=Anaeromyxobacter oryzisoli TaxID=2925408 RepID=UPI001F56BD5F|nr:TRIC cation channel family protein [Anaeromyxobacter sp. SG63]
MDPLRAQQFLERPFALDIAFDLAATFLFAVTGSLIARKKRYDAVGAIVLAFVTGLGGALLRDALFLREGPPAVITDGRYLGAVLAGAAATFFFSKHLQRLRLVFMLADALALGTYAMVGEQKALAAGLPVLTALLVAVVNAVGGGVLRDVLVREEPLIFKPGEFYALAALAGAVAFLGLARGLHLPPTLAALVGIAVAFAARMLSVRLGWRTGALWDEEGRSGP